MKKVYEAPSVEKISFMYRDQVVVASGNIGGVTKCTTETFHIYDGAEKGNDTCHQTDQCYEVTGDEH